MNVHHLELFYYVAKYGGISEAVRNIPYGIQQPAMSGQVIQLEEFLGITLFQRRPFALTASAPATNRPSRNFSRRSAMVCLRRANLPSARSRGAVRLTPS